MKRSISINISGLVFNIEENAYEALRDYLKGIKQYFAEDEDSLEIIADIEARIAEVFYEKLSPNKQIINAEDVAELIKNMGNVSDFEAVEQDPAYEVTFSAEEESSLEIPTEEEFDPLEGALVTSEEAESLQAEVKSAKPNQELPNIQKESKPREAAFSTEDFIAQYEPQFERNYQQEKTKVHTSDEDKTPPYRRLFRDTKRKVIGGVAAGLAHYVGIDMLWLRLIFLAFSLGFYFIPAIPSTMILIYIAVWFVAPGNDNLEEIPVKRRLFRDPERGELGGVCTGLAVFFGIPEIIVRLLFLGSVLIYGTGFMLYLMLWVLLPPIRNLHDRLQMIGKPFNLANIKAFNKSEELLQEADMSTLHKVILFPFQIIALSLQKTKRIMRPLVNFVGDATRVLGGLFLFLISLLLLFAITLPLVIFMGWDLEVFNDSPIPTYVLWQSFDLNLLTLLNFYFTAAIPVLLIGFFGVMMLRRQILWHGLFGWATLGLWFLSLTFSVASVLMVAKEFVADNSIEETQEYTLSAEEPLQVQVLFMPDIIAPKLKFEAIRGYEGEKVKVVSRYTANGSNVRQARQYAKMLSHRSRLQKSSLLIDEKTPFTEDAKFRNQSVSLELYIPYGQKFILDGSLKYLGYYFLENHDLNDIEGKVIFFSETDRVVCESCP